MLPSNWLFAIVNALLLFHSDAPAPPFCTLLALTFASVMAELLLIASPGAPVELVTVTWLRFRPAVLSTAMPLLAVRLNREMLKELMIETRPSMKVVDVEGPLDTPPRKVRSRILLIVTVSENVPPSIQMVPALPFTSKIASPIVERTGPQFGSPMITPAGQNWGSGRSFVLAVTVAGRVAVIGFVVLAGVAASDDVVNVIFVFTGLLFVVAVTGLLAASVGATVGLALVTVVGDALAVAGVLEAATVAVLDDALLGVDVTEATGDAVGETEGAVVAATVAVVLLAVGDGG